MKASKHISLTSLAATAAAVIVAFGLAAPSAHAQVGFGISIGSPGYAQGGYAPGAGYVWQQGFWASDPDGDGNRRWQPGGWVQSYQPSYYGNQQYNNYGGYPAQYGYRRRGGDDENRYYRRGEGYGGYRHRDDDDER